MGNIEITKKVAKISKITGFTRLSYFLNKKRKRTIAYHNIVPDRYWDDSFHLDYSTRESSFKSQLDIMKKRLGVSLDTEDTSKVTITFDDGYLNQYSIASKIMDDKDIQGYFFCAANILNNKRVLVMDSLQYWFSYVPYGKYNIDDINLNIKDRESRKIEYIKIQSVLDLELSEKIEKLLDSTYPFSKIDIDEEFYNIRFGIIGEENINKMKKRGHKIGAHSTNHIRLSNLSIKNLDQDISTCANMIDREYNTNIFCYPFGGNEDINNNVIEITKNKGFEKAFAYCNIPLSEGYNNFFMPRMILPDSCDEDLIEFTLSGAKYMIKYRRLLPKY